MAIDEEMRSTIVRLSRAEGWPVGTIARHLGVHHGTVTRALRAAGAERRPRAKFIDTFVPFIRKQLEEEPRLPAGTLWRQVKARGYQVLMAAKKRGILAVSRVLARIVPFPIVRSYWSSRTVGYRSCAPAGGRISVLCRSEIRA